MNTTKVFFKNEIEKDYYTGMTLFNADEVKADSATETIVCKGNIGSVMPNTPMQLYGEWKNNRFIVDRYEISNDQNMTATFLRSFAKKQITDEDAWYLSTHFAKGFFATIDDCTSMQSFRELVDKPYKKAAKAIYHNAKRYLSNEKLCKLIFQYGGNYSECTALMKAYADKAYDTVLEAPFQPCIEGLLNFATCDKIAALSHTSRYASDRLLALGCTVMRRKENDGSTFCEKEQFLRVAGNIARGNALGEIYEDFLWNKIVLTPNIFKVVTNKENSIGVMLRSRYVMEKDIAFHIKRICGSARTFDFSEDKIDEIERKNNIKLDASQRKCFDMLRTSGIKILEGGPGTGKTTTVNALLDYIDIVMPDKKKVLCAPTGCAAQNLSAKTNRTAQTVHKTLDYKPFDNDSQLGIVKNLDADICIVDEFSMLDEELLYLLLSAMPNAGLLIFIGDGDQLPSVKYGNIVNDIKSFDKVEVYTLNVTHRQSNDSPIVSNANAINHNETQMTTTDDFKILRADSENTIKEMALKIMREDDKFMCLAPLKKHACGTMALNRLLSPNKNGEHKKYNNANYYVHDKIITIRNNYAKGYWNGDLGEVTGFDEMGMEIRIGTSHIYLDNSELIDVLPAYAITIHKSQGSEYDRVLIILPQDAVSFANKKILYTAVTRAKSKVVIISESDALEQIIRKNDKERCTMVGNMFS